jgi:hypothetical protein
MLSNKSRTQDRITIVETVYHASPQSPEAPPTHVDTRCHRYLETVEQVYYRGPPSLKANTVWKAIDMGWVSPVGMFLIKNLESSDVEPIYIPVDQDHDNQVTPESFPVEEVVLPKMDLELGIQDFSVPTGGVLTICKIPAGESQRLTPMPDAKWFIRSVEDIVKFACYVFPS